MLKVHCEACGAPYEVDPRRVPPNGMKMRCPACGASVHVAPPSSRPSPTPLDDLELDLPAPKPVKTQTMGGLSSPGTIPGTPASKKADAEHLSDLPALKRPKEPAPNLSATAGDDLTDLPALRAKRDEAAAFKKTVPAVLRPVETLPPEPKPPEDDLDLDLPAPKPRATAASEREAAAKARSSDLDLDLPAPKPRGGDVDLPAPKPRGGALSLDLPAPKTRPGMQPPGALRDGAASASGQSPAPASAALPPAASAATPKKSFAKPGAQPPPSEPTPSAKAPPSAEPSLGGGLPRDSLALEPRPFFASAAPVGMFSKLDEVAGAEDAPAPAGNEVVDLPAPNDLPAVKRPAPKGTSFGLGPRLPPAESLELPKSFGPLDALPPVEEPPLPPAPLAAEPLSELDLPAPRDLPAVKKKKAPAATALGLGAPPPAGRSTFEVQPLGEPPSEAGASPLEFSLDLPPMSGREPAAPPLDLGDFDSALENLESRGGGSFGARHADLELAPRPGGKALSPSLSDLEPIALPSAGASNTNTVALHTLDLAPPQPQELLLTGAERGFSLSEGGEAQRGGGGRQTGLDLKNMLELGAPNDAGPQARNLASFGELDLGLGRESSVGLAFGPQARGTEAGTRRPTSVEDAQLVEKEETALERRLRRRKMPGRTLPGWVVPLSVVVLLGGGGVALGLFTEHGYFGVYLVEQLLPAAGEPAHVHAAIQQAERQAQPDTYVALRKALVTLSDARNEAGLNRELLARSLLHEALYQLRFGEDAQSAQRSAAILARVLERGSSAAGLSLARAADAARRGDLPEAKRLLSEVPAGNDPFRGLVAGELALLAGELKAAEDAFQEAAQRGEIARGQWGLARALKAQGKLDQAEQAAKATLAASPRHSAAHMLLTERALVRGEIEAAADHARRASGHALIDGQRAQPSRMERAHALALEGRVEEKRDHPREAQAAYELALAADPLSVDVLLGSGRMLMRLGRPQDALSRFDSALSAKPSTTPGPDGRIPMLDAGLGSIQALLALERPQEALTRAAALLQQYPDQPEVKLWYGHVLQALERWDDAEAAFRETMEKAPKLFAGYVALSQLLFKRNRPEEAARVLSRATGQVDDSAEVRRMLGNSELTRNHLPEAVHQFEAALHFDASDPGALFGLVVAHRKTGNIDAADEALTKLEQVDPTFPGLALERGQLFELRGRYDRAIATYRRAIEQRPNDSELKLRLGAALVTAGEVDEAETVLGQVLKERPTSAEAEHYLGRVLFARRETAQAVQRFERAVNFDNGKAEYHMYLGWALLEQGNFGGALQSIERAIERDPNLGDARWLLGRVQLRTGAVRDALMNFQAALRLKPGRVEALANIGDAYDELRDLPQAIKSYQEAVKRAPENGEWWYRLGQLHLDKGNRDQARVTLAEAVLRGDRMRERPSWLADAHRAYGDVLRESKRVPEAIDQYRTFLELAPLGHPDRAEIEKLVFQTRR